MCVKNPVRVKSVSWSPVYLFTIILPHRKYTHDYAHNIQSSKLLAKPPVLWEASDLPWAFSLCFESFLTPFPTCPLVSVYLSSFQPPPAAFLLSHTPGLTASSGSWKEIVRMGLEDVLYLNQPWSPPPASLVILALLSCNMNTSMMGSILKESAPFPLHILKCFL